MSLQPHPHPSAPDPEFAELVDRVLDHEASLEDIARLNAVLPQDPAVLRYFVKMRMLHAALEDHFKSTSTALDSIKGRAGKAPDASAATIPTALPDLRPHSRARSVWRLGRWAAAAAILPATLAVFWGAGKVLHPPVFEIVARSGQLTPSSPLNGSWLRKGDRIVLGRTTLDLRAANGTSLTFQGPGELTIGSTRVLNLTSGRLWAVVDSEPILVDTPNGRITDLGTTFGIDQSSPGSTRIDVFDGRVRLADPADTTRSSEAAAGFGLSRQASQWPPTSHPADASRYSAGLHRPAGLVFVKNEAERAVIGSGLPMNANWTPVTEAAGKSSPVGASYEIAWSGSSFFTTPAGESPTAALFQTHLEGWGWSAKQQEGARKLGLPVDGSTGIVIQLRRMAGWLTEIGARGYRVTLLRNSAVPGVDFLPVAIHSGASTGTTTTTIHKLWDEDYLAADYPDGTSDKGARAVELLAGPFTDDTLTLTLPVQPTGEMIRRTNISAVLVTPVFPAR